MYRLIVVSLVLTTLASAGASSAQAASRKCSNASLRGSYGVSFEGRSNALGQFVSVSVWRFNGKGRMRATEHYTSERTGPQSRRISGRYSVARNCSFKLFFGSQLGKQHEAHGECVLVANRREFTCLDNEEGWFTIGRGRKM